MYPSAIATLTNPNPSDKLNSPSHSSIESAQNDNIEQMQTFVGTLSSAVGTLVYDIRSANSNGGGHVQSANKGGTGQTTFIKGDILVATSSSVLAKLAVGQDGAVLRANSSISSGIKWDSTVTPKVATSASTITIGDTLVETSIMSVSILGSTLGNNNAIRATIFVKNFGVDSANTVVRIRGIYGNSSFATINIASVTGGGSASLRGTVVVNLLANNSVSSQKGILQTNFAKSFTTASVVLGNVQYVSTPINEDSSANKTLGVTMQYTNTSGADSTFDTDGYIIERLT